MRPEVAEILQQINVLLQRLADVVEDQGGSAGKPPGPVDNGPGVLPRDERAHRVYYAPPATYRVKDGVTLAIDGDKPHWITTNATGAMVLRGCSGQQTVGDVAASVCQRYGIAADVALTDTLAFLEALEAAEYVTQSPRLAPPYGGRSSAIGLGRLADVYLFVTNDCNLRCTHCYVSSGEYVPPREMTTDEILGLVDQARDLGADRFLITGGEPFMVRDIFTIIRHITAENDLVVLTNGMFFSEKYITRLKESLGRGRISFQISIDGPTAELHDAIRGKGSFAKTIPAIQRVIGHGFDVAISTAVSMHTVDHMTDMTRLVGRLGARAHHILFMQEWGRAIDNKPELMILPARASEVLRECVTVGEEIGVTIDNDASLRVRDPRQAWPQDRPVQLRLGHPCRVQRRPGLSLRLACRRSRHGMRQHSAAAARRHLARLRCSRSGPQRFRAKSRAVQRLPPEVSLRRRLALLVSLRQPGQPRQERPSLRRALLRDVHGLDACHALGAGAGRRAGERRQRRIRSATAVQCHGRGWLPLRQAEHGHPRSGVRGRLVSLRVRPRKRRHRGCCR